MKIYTLVVGELQENCYVVVNEKNEAIVIDPGAEIKRILQYTAKFFLFYIQLY